MRRRSSGRSSFFPAAGRGSTFPGSWLGGGGFVMVRPLCGLQRASVAPVPELRKFARLGESGGNAYVCLSRMIAAAFPRPRLQENNVTKPELGTKRVCAGCNAKFYDLMKDPIVCPKCETVFVVPDPEPARPAKRNYNLRSAAKPVAVAEEPVAAVKTEGEEPEVEDDENAKDDEGGVALLDDDEEER